MGQGLPIKITTCNFLIKKKIFC
jgi:hypothetical protein